MLLELPPILATLEWGTPLFVSVMFLPTLLELMKPKDAGPRLIISNLTPISAESAMPDNVLQDLEKASDIDERLIALFQNTFGFIQNLDG